MTHSKDLPRLIVDENVAGLARWLRFLGFDTLIAVSGTPDPQLAQFAKNENRILITRDRRLAGSVPIGRSIHLASDDFKSQLSTVLNACGKTEPAEWFLNCSECNRPLTELSPLEVDQNPFVPGFVKESKDLDIHVAWKCPQCERIYWRGSHYRRTKELLERLLQDRAR